MALTLTGLSRESAKFQARSAFSGVGFTTNESENVVRHPVRRRIVMVLMLLGNIGVATVAATLMVSLLNATSAGSERWTRNILLLVIGLGGLAVVARSQWIERHLNQLIAWSLREWTQVDVRDYVALLQLSTGYAVTELKIEPNDWLSGKSLLELRLPTEGVLVLGIQRRDGAFIGAPKASSLVQPFDTLILYGPLTRLAELDERRAGQKGDRAHENAVQVHEDVVQREEELDPAITD